MPRGDTPPQGQKRSSAQIQSMQKARLASVASNDAAMGQSTTSDIVEKPVAAVEPTMADLVEKLSLTEEEVPEKDAEILQQGIALQTANILLEKIHAGVQAAKERGNMWHEK